MTKKALSLFLALVLFLTSGMSAFALDGPAGESGPVSTPLATVTDSPTPEPSSLPSPLPTEDVLPTPESPTPVESGAPIETEDPEESPPLPEEPAGLLSGDPASIQAALNQVVELINTVRGEKGLSLLSAEHTQLRAAAAARALELLERFDSSRLRPNGLPTSTLLEEMGVPFTAECEAVGRGYGSPEAAFAQWMNTPDIRAAILNEDFECIGVGYACDENGPMDYWALLFVRVAPIPTPPPPAETSEEATAPLLSDIALLAIPDVTVSIKTLSGVPSPVCGKVPAVAITPTLQYTGTIVWQPSDAVFAIDTQYTATITLTPNTGYTLTGVPANFFTLAGATSVTHLADSGVITAVFPKTGYPPATLLTISPSVAILSRQNEQQTFTATFLPADADFSQISWSVSPAEGVTLTPSEDKKTATLTLLADVAQGSTLLVKAACSGPPAYVATATVELAPPSSAPTAALFQRSVTINTLQTSGALVPVHLKNVASPEDIQANLKVYNSRSAQWEDSDAFTATFRGDIQSIEIKANAGAKTTKNVQASLSVDGTVLEAGTLDLTVVTQYPKITLAADALDLFHPEEKASLTAVSNVGDCLNLKATFSGRGAVPSIEPGPDANTLALSVSPGLKRGSYKATVELDIDGYSKAYKTKPTVTVPVVDNVSKLKLSASTLTLLSGPAPAKIQLLSTDSALPLESLGAIDRATLDDEIDNLYEDGWIMIPGATSPGTHVLKIKFVHRESVLAFKLTVKVVDPAKVTVLTKAQSVLVSAAHQGYITAVELALSAANATRDDWIVTKGTLPNGIVMDSGDNRIAFSVSPGATLQKTQKPVALEINSKNSPLKIPLRLSLSITDQPLPCSISLKGKIDIANPQSALTATVKLSDSTFALESATLTGSSSDLFETFGFTQNTFQIRVADGKTPTPGVKHSLQVGITLQNGDSLAMKTISITPSQTAGKAYQSKKEVSLYTDTLLMGEEIDLGLTTPANVKLGSVKINEKSIQALRLCTGGFLLERTGENTWVIKFDERAPVPQSGKVKPSYTIKLELWAKGTYQLDADGNPTALLDSRGKEKSRPTLVTVKVNVNPRTPAPIPIKDLSGARLSLNFSPYYRPGSSPDWQSKISADTIRKALTAIAPYTDTIRTFGVTGELNKMYKIAKEEYGLRVIAGCWIGRGYTDEQVQAELNALAALGNQGLADILVVGSEGLERHDYTADQLIGWIADLRTKLTKPVPIGTSDTEWNFENNLDVIKAVDVVLFTHYPFWAKRPVGISIDNAVADFLERFYSLRGIIQNDLHLNTPIICSETGWKFDGTPNGAAIPSLENGARYFEEICQLSKDKSLNLEICYFQAVEEGWKKAEDRGWGLFDQKLKPRPSIEDALAQLRK